MNQNDFLKCVAVITMTIDHIGAVFFPHLLWLRAIGRISFPLFAYQCAVGATYTKNKQKYLMRLLMFAVVSQPIYYILFQHGLNIGFTLLYGVGLIILWQTGKRWLTVIIGAVAIFCPFIDYGFYGVYIIPVFYVYLKNQTLGKLFLVILNGIYVAATTVVIQLLSLLAVFLLDKKWKVTVKLPKYFFYAYYPIHLIVFFFILQFSNQF